MIAKIIVWLITGPARYLLIVLGIYIAGYVVGSNNSKMDAKVAALESQVAASKRDLEAARAQQAAAEAEALKEAQRVADIEGDLDELRSERAKSPEARSCVLNDSDARRLRNLGTRRR